MIRLSNHIILLAIFVLFSGFNQNMKNFESFFVVPDDENDQVRVSWVPKSGVQIKSYFLEKSSDNEHFDVWKKIKDPQERIASGKLFEIDFEPFDG